jgi:hypothetical protein
LVRLTSDLLPLTTFKTLAVFALSSNEVDQKKQRGSPNEITQTLSGNKNRFIPEWAIRSDVRQKEGLRLQDKS